MEGPVHRIVPFLGNVGFKGIPLSQGAAELPVVFGRELQHFFGKEGVRYALRCFFFQPFQVGHQRVKLCPHLKSTHGFHLFLSQDNQSVADPVHAKHC